MCRWIDHSLPSIDEKINPAQFRIGYAILKSVGILDATSRRVEVRHVAVTLCFSSSKYLVGNGL